MLPHPARAPWRLLLATFTLAFVASAHAAQPVKSRAALADDPEGRAMVESARRVIDGYHADQPANGAKLRVVYFHPSDRDPLPGYAERLDRALNDISDFYRDGLRRLGVPSEGLPLERKGGRVLLHLVRGKLPASGYRHESGDETWAEVRAALKDVFDADREHVLILYALCRQEPDGRYVFDAPYYGDGASDQRAGLCHAADCELLDPVLLRETRKKIVYTEHYFPRKQQTLARFNSWYLGGIAHELGHGLGLDHDAGSFAEIRFGTSLMGGGNHTYRQETWGGGGPTYLSRATVLQLAAHPLVTGSDRGRRDDIGTALRDVRFSAAGRGLKIEGKVAGEIPAYAVAAYVCLTRDGDMDHASESFPALIKDGAFSLRLRDLRRDDYRLRLVSFHANGGTTERDFELRFDAAGRPDTAALNAAWREKPES